MRGLGDERPQLLREEAHLAVVLLHGQDQGAQGQRDKWSVVDAPRGRQFLAKLEGVRLQRLPGSAEEPIDERSDRRQHRDRQKPLDERVLKPADHVSADIPDAGHSALSSPHAAVRQRRARSEAPKAAVTFPAGTIHPDVSRVSVQLRDRRGGSGRDVDLAVPPVADRRPPGRVRTGNRQNQSRQRLAHRARRDPGQEPERPGVAVARLGRPAIRRSPVAHAREHPRSGAGGLVRAGAGQGEPRLHAQRAGQHRGEELHAARARVLADLPAAVRRRAGRRDLQERSGWPIGRTASRS